MATSRRLSQQRMQPVSFAVEGRPKSSESFGTIRRKFLEAPLPVPEDDEDSFRPSKLYSPVNNKKKKKKKKKSKEESFDPNNDDREQQRMNELKEWLIMDADKSKLHHELKIAMLKHMRVLDDLEKLKAHYYLEYMDALTDKVEEQRKSIQEKSELHRRRLIKKEKKEKEAAQKAKIQMHRPHVTSDNTFLKNLPRTKYHKIIVLQDQLIREGRIRRDEEMRVFWQEIAKPEVYRSIFGEEEVEGTTEGAGTMSIKTRPTLRGKEGEVTASEVESQASASESLPECESQIPGSLAQIDEAREPSRPDSMAGPYVQSWVNAPKSKKKISQALLARKPVHPKVLEMEQRCPRVEFPKLAAFSLDLEPPKEDPEVELMREDFKMRARLRNQEVRRLRKMYEMSVTNDAATRRIFDQKEEFSQVFNGPALRDVLFVQNPSDHLALVRSKLQDYEDEKEEETNERQNERLALPGPENVSPTRPINVRKGSNPGRSFSGFAIERISEEGDIEDEEELEEEGEGLNEEVGGDKLLTYSSRSSSRRSSWTSTESEKRRNTPVMPEPRKPHPLTMEAVMEKSHTRVIKGPSALWVNYGKFLPPVK